MTFKKQIATLSISTLIIGQSHAFAPAPVRFGVTTTTTGQHARFDLRARQPLYATSPSDDKGEEVDRLRSMAAKLRNEVAMLERETQEEKQQEAVKAFQKFDADKNGFVTLEELKAGLEKNLKLELSETRVQRLIDDFDTNGDGVLQQDEFVGIEKFRNQLEQIFRQEKQESLFAKKKSQAQKEAEEKLGQVKELINDGPPTATDKVVAVLPYLLPLLDSVQFGSLFLAQHQDNPLVQALAILTLAYRSIPFAPFLAFFSLSFLGDNLAINKLVRFNAKQAVFLDIAQFFPSVLATLVALVSNAGKFEIPPAVVEAGADAVFATMLLAITYSVVSSALGETPDKIPFISEAVSRRIPTIDLFNIDDQGRLVLKEPNENEDKKD